MVLSEVGPWALSTFTWLLWSEVLCCWQQALAPLTAFSTDRPTALLDKDGLCPVAFLVMFQVAVVQGATQWLLKLH